MAEPLRKEDVRYLHWPDADRRLGRDPATCKGVGNYVLGPNFWDELKEPGYEPDWSVDPDTLCND
jgi:hypothetical protein